MNGDLYLFHFDVFFSIYLVLKNKFEFIFGTHGIFVNCALTNELRYFNV